MHICLDIGNTNIVIGIFKEKKLIEKFRISTDTKKTGDEYGISLLELLNLLNIDRKDIKGFIISSVVPEIDHAIKRMVEKYFHQEPIFVGQGTKSGIKIKLDNPKQLGADLLVGAVGAVDKYGGNVLVIDIGTALTITYINDEKEFLGGSILPGIRTAFSSLSAKASKLEEVGLQDTTVLLGKDTKTCIQSGMIFGYASLLDGMIKRYMDEYGDLMVVITGGEAKIIHKYLNPALNVIFDETLLLDGLNILYYKNKRESEKLS